MRVGDLIKTKSFGPHGSRDEIGVLVKPHPLYNHGVNKVWMVAFGRSLHWLATAGFEVISESR